MSIDHAVAIAIHDDLDIAQAWPQIEQLPVEALAPAIDDFIEDLQEALTDAIEEKGIPYLVAGDAGGLCEALLGRVRVPFPMLLKMCRTIVEMWDVEECRCTPLVYFVRLKVCL
jgi:hypothetical protein